MGIECGNPLCCRDLFRLLIEKTNKKEQGTCTLILGAGASVLDGLLDGLYIPGNIEIFVSLFASTMFAASPYGRAAAFLPIIALSLLGKVTENMYGGRVPRFGRAWHVVRALLNGAKNMAQACMMLTAFFLDRDMDNVADDAFNTLKIFGYTALILAMLRALTSTITAFHSLRTVKNRDGVVPGNGYLPPGSDRSSTGSGGSVDHLVAETVTMASSSEEEDSRGGSFVDSTAAPLLPAGHRDGSNGTSDAAHTRRAVLEAAAPVGEMPNAVVIDVAPAEVRNTATTTAATSQSDTETWGEWASGWYTWASAKVFGASTPDTPATKTG